MNCKICKLVSILSVCLQLFLIAASLLPGKSYIHFTDSSLKRYGGTYTTLTELEFTHLIQSDPNVVFVPVKNGKSFFSSYCINNANQTKFEPILLNGSELDSVFSNVRGIVPSSQVETLSESDVNELFTYLGMKSHKHYVSVECSESTYDSSVSSFDTALTDYSQTKRNKDLNINIESYKIMWCNFRKVANYYYDTDVKAENQLSAIIALAGGYSSFHMSTRHCRKCGSKTKSQKCGSSRSCTNQACKTTSYPRVEPATIMLIESQCRTYCLLGRKAEWEDGQYSTLAGFTELGESLEQTVVREVFEESSVAVDLASIEYVASQPWLFPSSLMIGFQATAAATATAAVVADMFGGHDDLPQIEFDKKEMDDVRWFSKYAVTRALQRQFGLDFVQSPPLSDAAASSLDSSHKDMNEQDIDDKLKFPGPTSLSRVLIKRWCMQQ